jgi:hypothetical protein
VKVSFISPSVRWKRLGIECAQDDVSEGYVPNGSVSVDTLAHDAYSMLLEDGEIPDSDEAWSSFYDGYASEMEELL